MRGQDRELLRLEDRGGSQTGLPDVQSPVQNENPGCVALAYGDFLDG